MRPALSADDIAEHGMPLWRSALLPIIVLKSACKAESVRSPGAQLAAATQPLIELIQGGAVLSSCASSLAPPLLSPVQMQGVYALAACHCKHLLGIEQGAGGDHSVGPQGPSSHLLQTAQLQAVRYFADVLPVDAVPGLTNLTSPASSTQATSAAAGPAEPRFASSSTRAVDGSTRDDSETGRDMSDQLVQAVELWRRILPSANTDPAIEPAGVPHGHSSIGPHALGHSVDHCPSGSDLQRALSATLRDDDDAAYLMPGEEGGRAAASGSAATGTFTESQQPLTQVDLSASQLNDGPSQMEWAAAAVSVTAVATSSSTMTGDQSHDVAPVIASTRADANLTDDGSHAASVAKLAVAGVCSLDSPQSTDRPPDAEQSKAVLNPMTLSGPSEQQTAYRHMLAALHQRMQGRAPPGAVIDPDSLISSLQGVYCGCTAICWKQMVLTWCVGW